MSVDYEAGIAKGYKLTYEEYKTIPDEIQDTLSDGGFLLCLTEYSYAPEYILGVPFYGTDSVDCFDLEELHIEDADEDLKMIHLFMQEYFPNRAEENPRLILYMRAF